DDDEEHEDRQSPGSEPQKTGKVRFLCRRAVCRDVLTREFCHRYLLSGEDAQYAYRGAADDEEPSDSPRAARSLVWGIVQFLLRFCRRSAARGTVAPRAIFG